MTAKYHRLGSMLSIAPDDMAPVSVPVATPGFGAPVLAGVAPPPLLVLPDEHAASSRAKAAQSAPAPASRRRLAFPLILVFLVIALSDPLPPAYLRLCTFSFVSLRVASVRTVSGGLLAGHPPQPRIEDRMQEVHDRVGEHGDEGGDDNDAGNDRVVEILDGYRPV